MEITIEEYKNKTKEARYQILYDYREKLMKYPNNYRAHAATVATANKFEVELMTVYRAVKFVRSGKGATE